MTRVAIALVSEIDPLRQAIGSQAGIAADVRRKLSHRLSIALEPRMERALAGLRMYTESDFQVAPVADASQRPAACQSPAHASGLPKK